MQHTDFNWTTPEGINMYGQTWSPDAAPRAVIALAHGLGEHSGRYAHVAAFFAKAGIATVAYDRSGHGKSGGKRGHTTKYDFFLDEVAELVRQAKTQFPNLPVFLYGHSMGGNIVLNYVLRRQITDIAGVISSAAVVKLAFVPNAFILGLGKIMRNVYPAFSQNNQLDVNALSRDKAVVAAYVADPLVHDRLSSEAGLGILEYAQWLQDNARAVPVPMYLAHGSEDKTVSPDGSHWFAANYTGDITLKIWDGLYHEIHNEPEQTDVLNAMLAWVNSKI
jgi:acylglycerol lipase